MLRSDKSTQQLIALPPRKRKNRPLISYRTSCFLFLLSKEIDQFLLSYLSQLISSEQMKLNAVLDSSPVATLYQNNSKADSSGEQTSSSTSDTNRVQLKEKERQLSLERIEETLQQLAEYSKTTSSTSPIQEEIEELTAKNKVLKILLLIERRLKAELKYSSSFEMKLLGELINLPFSEVRSSM